MSSQADLSAAGGTVRDLWRVFRSNKVMLAVLQKETTNSVAGRFVSLAKILLTRDRIIDASTLERMNLIQYAWILFLQSHLVGHGIGTFRDLVANAPFAGIVSIYNNTYTHVELFEMLVGTGLLGTLLYYATYRTVISYRRDDQLEILAASLDQTIGQDAVLAAEDFSLTMLSANLYNLAIRAQEPLSETQVMDFTGRLLQEYDRRVLQTFGLDAAETADRHSQIINQILHERNRGDLTAWFEPLPDLDRQTRAMSLASWLLAGLAAFGVVLLSGTLCRSSL